MRILITGASGLVGTALLDHLRGNNHSIVCQSRHPHDDESGIHWFQHDLVSDSWEELSLPEFDCVFHLAGQTSTYVARQDPIADISANVIGLLRLLEYFRARKQCPFIVQAGTATEVGLVDQLPIREGTVDHPITFYDISKLSAEMYLKQYSREGLIRGCTLRFANVFGRNQPGQQRDRGIIDKIFSRALSGQGISIFGDGNYLRDYIFIDDVVSALVAASENMQQTDGRNFYIGSGQGTTLKDAFFKVIALAASVTGKLVPYEHVTPPAGLSEIEFRNAVIDFSAFRQATGWAPQYDFDTGIHEAYRDLLGRPS